MLEDEQERACRLCFHFVCYKHMPWWPNYGAKQPAQPWPTLASSFLDWKHREPWSHRGCKPQITVNWTWHEFSLSSHLPLRSSNEADKNNTKLSQSPAEMPDSSLLSWKDVSVFSWGILWNFNFLEKLSLDVFWFRIHFCPTNLKNCHGNQLLSDL